VLRFASLVVNGNGGRRRRGAEAISFILRQNWQTTRVVLSGGLACLKLRRSAGSARRDGNLHGKSAASRLPGRHWRQGSKRYCRKRCNMKAGEKSFVPKRDASDRSVMTGHFVLKRRRRDVHERRMIATATIDSGEDGKGSEFRCDLSNHCAALSFWRSAQLSKLK
jgi:hypothetical protein